MVVSVTKRIIMFLTIISELKCKFLALQTYLKSLGLLYKTYYINRMRQAGIFHNLFLKPGIRRPIRVL